MVGCEPISMHALDRPNLVRPCGIPLQDRDGGGALSRHGLIRVMEALVLAAHWPGKPALNALLKRVRPAAVTSAGAIFTHFAQSVRSVSSSTPGLRGGLVHTVYWCTATLLAVHLLLHDDQLPPTALPLACRACHGSGIHKSAGGKAEKQQIPSYNTTGNLAQCIQSAITTCLLTPSSATQAKMLRRFKHLSPLEDAQITHFSQQLWGLSGLRMRYQPAVQEDPDMGPAAELATVGSEGLVTHAAAGTGPVQGMQVAGTEARPAVPTQQATRQRTRSDAATRLLRRVYLARLHTAFKAFAGRLVGDVVPPASQLQSGRRSHARAQLQQAQQQAHDTASISAATHKLEVRKQDQQAAQEQQQQQLAQSVQLASAVPEPLLSEAHVAAMPMGGSPGVMEGEATSPELLSLAPDDPRAVGTNGSSPLVSYQYGDVGLVLLRALRLKFARTLAVLAGAALEQQQTVPLGHAHVHAYADSASTVDGRGSGDCA